VGVQIEVPDATASATVSAPLEVAFQRHYRSLVRLAVAFGMTSGDAEEVVQEAFIAFARRSSRVVVGSELAFLRRVTINAALSRHRRRARLRTRLRTLAAGQSDLADIAIDVGRYDALRSAIRALPERQRVCIVLRYFEGLTVDEIAEVIGISAGSIKTHLSRGRTTLRRHLEEDHDDR
jgi:RNA polymerase sigma-70 factor (ECF subfamily)